VAVGIVIVIVIVIVVVVVGAWSTELSGNENATQPAEPTGKVGSTVSC
jgi:hypothetical protein